MNRIGWCLSDKGESPQLARLGHSCPWFHQFHQRLRYATRASALDHPFSVIDPLGAGIILGCSVGMLTCAAGQLNRRLCGMRHASCHVEIRMLDVDGVADEVRRRLETWFVADESDLVFRSALRDTGDVNAHLKWFAAMLGHQRKFIRQLQSRGVRIVTRVYRDRLPLLIEPESLLLGHKLHLPIEIVATRPAA
jgi:hypothetical protein